MKKMVLFIFFSSCLIFCSCDNTSSNQSNVVIQSPPHKIINSSIDSCFIEVLDISPAPNSVVDSTTIIDVKLRTTIHNTQWDTTKAYRAVLIVPTIDTTWIGEGRGRDDSIYTMIDTAEISFKLSEVWDNEYLWHPFVCSFIILKEKELKAWSKLASTDTYCYGEIFE